MSPPGEWWGEGRGIPQHHDPSSLEFWVTRERRATRPGGSQACPLAARLPLRPASGAPGTPPPKAASSIAVTSAGPETSPAGYTTCRTAMLYSP